MTGTKDARNDLALELAAEYEVLEELGRGATSIVYRARDRILGRTVAIKVIRDSSMADPESTTRFEREAQMLARLEHPNIVSLYGARRLSSGTLVLVMQNGNWQTLKAVIQEAGPLPAVRVEQVLRGIGQALVYLHRNGVVHRDIKPENIFLDAESGHARLSDFGIARPADVQSSVTIVGSVLGTPAYMAPEQIDGAPASSQSDLYSLGMVGYEMLTGRRPWEGENLFSVIYKQKTELLPPLSGVRPDTPDPLRLAIQRAIEKDPAARWESAEEFVGSLGGAGVVAPAPRVLPQRVEVAAVAPSEPKALQVLAPVAPVPAVAPAELEPFGGHAGGARRNRGALIAAGLVAVLVGGGATIFALGRTPEAVAGAAAALDEPPPGGALAVGPTRAADRGTDSGAEGLDAEEARQVAPADGAGGGAPLPTASGAAAPPAAAAGRPDAPGAAAATPAAGTEPASSPDAGATGVEPGPRVLGRPTPLPPAPAPAPRPVETAPIASAAPAGVAAARPDPAAPVVAPVLRETSELTRAIRALPLSDVRRVQGGRTVLIAVYVNEAGRVTDSRIRTGSGIPNIDAALLEAVKGLRFDAATRGGSPVAVWVEIPVSLLDHL